MSKTCNQSKSMEGKMCNPLTGKWIIIGGPTYKTLIEKGIIKAQISSAPKTTIKTTAVQSKTTTAKPQVKGERKAPSVSATSVPVGTEMMGKDGMYIVKLRNNGTQYWAKCTFKTANCQTTNKQQGGNPIIAALPTLTELAIPAGLTAASHFAHNYFEEEQTGGKKPTNRQKSRQRGGNPLLAAASELAVPAVLTASAYYLSKKGQPVQTQEGGNPLLLQAASDLIVPLGLTAGAHWLASMKNTEQSGGNPLILKTIADLSVPIGLTLGAHYLSKKEQEQANQFGGAEGLPIIDDPIMNSYLGVKGIGLLTPQTLIPLGILLAVYAAYKYRYNDLYPETTTVNPENEQSGGVNEEVLNMVDKEDLDKYMKIKGITELTPQTELPFAALMGPDIFKQYVKEMEKKSMNRTNQNYRQSNKKNNRR